MISGENLKGISLLKPRKFLNADKEGGKPKLMLKGGGKRDTGRRREIKEICVT